MLTVVSWKWNLKQKSVQWYLSYPSFSTVFFPIPLLSLLLIKGVKEKNKCFTLLSFHWFSSKALSCFHYAGGTFPFLQTKKEVVLQIVLGSSLIHKTGKWCKMKLVLEATLGIKVTFTENTIESLSSIVLYMLPRQKCYFRSVFCLTWTDFVLLFLFLITISSEEWSTSSSSAHR